MVFSDKDWTEEPQFWVNPASRSAVIRFNPDFVVVPEGFERVDRDTYTHFVFDTLQQLMEARETAFAALEQHVAGAGTAQPYAVEPKTLKPLTLRQTVSTVYSTESTDGPAPGRKQPSKKAKKPV